MSDKEFGSSDDLSLPKATVQKIIGEVLAATTTGQGQSAMTFAKETRDLLIECCVEFITMISTEANEIAEKEAKKTIACEHVTKALDELGFGEYVPEMWNVAEQFKVSQVTREKKQSKMALDDASIEEMTRLQEEMLKEHGDKLYGRAGAEEA